MFGMETMSSSVSGLADIPAFRQLFLLFENPLLGVLAGAVLTAIIQSSSASVGILQALAMTGQVSYGAAIPIIMGDSIGTCVTALLSSEDVPMYVVGCSSYDQAEIIAADLASKGCQCIDLCPGFGIEGVARVKRAAGPGVKVGVVRYDTVPAFENQSGDELFK